MKANKIGVYFDGNYFYQVSNYYAYSHSRRKRPSLTGILDFIRGYVARLENTDAGHCLISDAHYFRMRAQVQEASLRTDQLLRERSFEDLLSSAGLQAHFLPQKFQREQRQDYRPDVWLALESYQNVRNLELDYVVLIAGGADYLPLISKLQSLGSRVILLSWDLDYVQDNQFRVIHQVPDELRSAAAFAPVMNDVLEDSDHPLHLLASSLFPGQNFQEEGSNEALPASAEGMEGTILNLRNGYGFIKYPPRNIFFHYSNLLNCDFQDLQSGDSVIFDLEKNEEGNDVAKNVRLSGVLEAG